MFDLGFSELLLVAVVALLVLGPEQMLSFLRHLGLWVRRFRVYSSQIKDDIDKELNLSEMRQHMNKLEQSARDPLSALGVDEQLDTSPPASSSKPSSGNTSATQTASGSTQATTAAKSPN